MTYKEAQQFQMIAMTYLILRMTSYMISSCQTPTARNPPKPRTRKGNLLLLSAQFVTKHVTLAGYIKDSYTYAMGGKKYLYCSKN